MRIIYLFSLFILLCNLPASAQGYYYKNRFIKLEQRPDGLMIVSKTSGFRKEDFQERINKISTDGFILKGIDDNYAFLSTSELKNESEIRNSIYKFSKEFNNIKFISPVYYGESKSVTQIITDEFVVKPRSKDILYRLDILNLQNNVYIKGVVNDGRALILKTNDNNTKSALELSEIYLATGLFEYAEPNFIYLADGFFNWTPNDSYYALQWPLNNTGQFVETGGYTDFGDAVTSGGYPDADMDVNLAWDFVKGNPNVIVAVFDTGVDSLHPDLKGNLYAGYNAYANNNTNNIDTNNHGTCCIGLIGARSNNGIGVAGIVGGDNGSNHCKVCSYRLIDNSGSFVSVANIARAFVTARVRGVHVSSNSWGGGSPNSTSTEAIENLANNGRGGLGCVILFSSGNGGRAAEYPSYLSSVVCVGASTNIDSKKSPGTGDQYWWGGCYGEDANGDLDLVAPTITTTTDKRDTMGYSKTDYEYTFNGTSCSCPNAAGVAALIFSVNPNLTKNQVLDYLYRGCDKIDNLPYSTTKTYGKWNPYTGYGRVNAYNSVRLAAGVDVTPPTINHKSPVVSTSTYPLTISAEIIDQDGSAVPSIGGNAPHLYFRKNPNNSGWTNYVSVYASSNSGNTFYFQIPCSGWQTEIQYYISAKDNSGNQSLFPKNAPSYPCYTTVGSAYVSSGTFASFTLPAKGPAISSNLNMADFKILDVSVSLNLTHTCLSDMNLQLWSPASDTKINRVCLFSRNGGNGVNITDAVVSDTGASLWRESSPPYNNLSAKPDHYLSTFRGQSSGGDWRLLYYDAVSYNGGYLSSAVLNITQLSGITSPSIKKDAVSDSVISFYALPGEKDTVDYYLRNIGTSNLIIPAYYFSGSSASEYSLINTPASPVAPNDSSLFRIVFSRPPVMKSNNGILKEATLNSNEAVLNIPTNDPTKHTFKISLYNEAPLPVSLLSFNYEISGRNVILRWITSTEVNNKGFYVERNESNLNAEKWNIVGFVNGKGSSSGNQDYLYEDKKLPAGKYSYRLKQMDNNGNYEFHYLNGIAEISLPKKFELSQNYPNPFNPVTKIDFSIPVNAFVRLDVYDVSGRMVKTLLNGEKSAGYYNVTLDASELSSGIYIYTISAKTNNNIINLSRKMVLLK